MSDIATKKISELDQVTSFDNTDVFLLQTDDSTVTIAAASLLTGTNITYSNSSSGLSATTVQAAIDEIVSEGVGDDLPFTLAIVSGSYGYYDTSGTFHSFRQPTGTATASQVLSGYTFSNADEDGLAGSMTDKSGTTTSATASVSSSRVRLKIPTAGYYDTSAYLYASYSSVASVVGLSASDLISGTSVLGITGTGTWSRKCLNACAYYNFSGATYSSESNSYTMTADGTVYYSGMSGGGMNSVATCQIYKNGTLVASRDISNNNYVLRTTMYNKSFSASEGDVILVSCTATRGSYVFAWMTAECIYFA